MSYEYLWAREHEQGEESGRKARPVVVVIATVTISDRTQLLVAPITTKPPANPAEAVELPPRVKSHLSLDGDRCWIMLTELNRFIWPGPDLRPIDRRGKASPAYGEIPSRLFGIILAAIVERANARKLNITPRTE